MRVCIVGCGAIGSLFAAYLAQADDVEVWAYDSFAEHMRAINENGLRLSGLADLVARIQATSDASQLPACDYGIVATKGMHTKAAIAATAHAFAGGAVCSVQNGIGNEEIIAEHVSEVMRGMTVPAGHLIEPGHAAQDIGGDTYIGPFEPRPAPLEKVRELAGALTRSGLTTHGLADARGAQWRKVIFNIAANATAAVTGLTHGRIYELAPMRELAFGLIAEGRAVAEAQGIVIDDPTPEAVFEETAGAGYEHRASMLQDIQAGRDTEIGFLNGAIVDFGERHGVPTPLNRALTALVKGIEYRRKEQP